MRKLFSFFSLLIFALLLCACSFLGDAQKTGSVSFCIGDGVYSKISASRAADENTEGEYYLQVSLNGGYSEEKTMPIHENTIRAIMTFGDIPEGAEVWAYALIYEVFDGEKEYILEGTSEKITIAEGDNALSITMTSYKRGGINNTPIGSKERPDAVSDIVFSDGTAVAYSEDLVLTGEQVDAAVAVIFYVGGDSDIGERILGVGLKESDAREWAVSDAFCYGRYASTSSYNGIQNWEKITIKDTSAATTPENYPAFKYANEYSVGVFTSGWYVPAQSELKKLRTNVEAVNNAINKIKETRAGVSVLDTTSGIYWTSSEYSSAISNLAYFVEFATTSTSTTDREQKNTPHIVRPIHAF